MLYVGIYLIMVFAVFMWRCKNIIRFREGEDFIGSDAGFDYSKELYDSLISIQKILHIGKALTIEEVGLWNRNIRNLNFFWKRIYFAILLKSLLFPH